MTFPILGGNSGAEAELITNSLRFNDNDSPYLSRTNSSGGDRQKFTTSFWIKRGNLTGSGIKLFDAGTSTSTDSGRFFIGTFGTEKLVVVGGATTYRVTSQVFRDTSAWYHIIVAVDSTQGTADNRIKIYVNGNQVTSFDTNNAMTQNQNTPVNENAKSHQIARNQQSGSEHYDGYIAEFHHIDGQQLDETSFGEFDTDSGIWKPIEYTGSYGTNGFYLKFNNSGSLGADSSGNGNNFTATNLASTDQTTDTPLNNFATLNFNDAVDSEGSDYNITGLLSEGNLDFKGGGAGTGNDAIRGTIGISSGKWYWESKIVDNTKAGYIGISASEDLIRNGGSLQGDTAKTSVIWDVKNGDITKNGSSVATGYGVSTGDIVGLAFDLDGGNLYIYQNGTALNSGSAVVTGISDNVYLPFVGCENGSTINRQQLNFGNPVHSISSGNSDANGYGNFEYSVPSGYLALCTQNLATELSPTIDDASEYFGTTLWVADDTSPRTLTGFGHKPDFLWVKHRGSGSISHTAVDSSRGGDKMLSTDATSAEDTKSHGEITSFNADGITVADGTSATYPKLYFNDLNPFGSGGGNYVAFHWVANAGTTSSNTDGSITSTVQANTTAGFSIVTFTGNATAGATVGHGLGVKPEIIFSKNRSIGTNWNCYVEATDNTGDYTLTLNASGGRSNSFNMWNDTAPTSSVITLGNRNETNGSSHNMVHFVFHSVEGYSKFGKYTGSGSSDGVMVTTMFRPAFVMYKRTDTTGNWLIFDSKRTTFNVADDFLQADLTDAEATSNANNRIDILSNGFKHRGSGSASNASSGTYIYMAFAENPFVTSSGVPVTAR